jgi:hypothetical protein
MNKERKIAREINKLALLHLLQILEISGWASTATYISSQR